MKRYVYIILCVAIYFAITSEGFCQSVAPEKAPAKTISLDLKGMDIADVLKLISMKSGMNIVAGKNVRGKVTIFLKDVNPDDALDIILAANDLAYEKRGDIINVMTARDYELIYGERHRDMRDVRSIQLKYVNAADVAKALNQVKTNLGKVIVDEGSNILVLVDVPSKLELMEKMAGEMDVETETEVFGLDYAKAEDIKDKVKESLTKNVGRMQTDERTNKIVVTDIPSRMKEIEKMVKAFDERNRQVLIEAKMIQIELNDEFRMGVDWDNIFSASGTTYAKFSENFDITSGGSIIGGSATGGGLRIGTMTEPGEAIIMEALKKMGKTHIISSPRVAVLNNETASIQVGTNQPYATSTTSIGQTTSEVAEEVTFLDLGITLDVTPTISSDGFVTMKIKPEVSSKISELTTSQNNLIPVVKTSTAETTVMVKDGHTIVIGGLIETRDEKEVNKVPLLGDIPILGNLFRSTTRGSESDPEKQELVIFLKPKIIGGDVDSPEVYQYLSVEKKKEGEPQGEAADTEKKMAESPEGLLPLGEAVEEGAPPETAKAKPQAYPLPTEQMSYSDYYQLIKRKMGLVARDNYTNSGIGGGKVYLSFVLNRSGEVEGNPKVLHATNSKLADIARRSLRQAYPFPPFPSSIEEPKKTFRILISFE